MGVVIPLDGAGNKKRASIEPLVKLTQADMERVNESILSHARSHVELIPETIVVEAEPTGFPRASISKKRVWFDARTGLPVCMVTYDRRGEMFKSFDGAYSVYDNKGKQVMDGKNPYWSWTLVHAHDVQSNRMTRLKQVRTIAGGWEMFVNRDNKVFDDFLTTAAQAAELVDAVNHPSFKCMYDTFHAHIEEKSQAGPIAALGNRFAHVHISENDRGVPGSGQVRWDEAFAALKKSGYDGWLTIEAFGGWLPELAGATCIWRNMAPSEEHVARHGLDFIKKNI